jgi:hypothetical protein
VNEISSVLAAVCGWLMVWVSIGVINAMRGKLTPWHMRLGWVLLGFCAFSVGVGPFGDQPSAVPWPAAVLLAALTAVIVMKRKRLEFEVDPTRGRA